MEIESIVKNQLKPSADYIYGFADLNGLLPDEYKNYSFGISIGKRLDNSVVDLVKNGPTVDYYNHYREINNDLQVVSNSITDELRKNGINCVGIVPTFILSSNEFKPYLKKLRYKVSHKMIATRAGLGWIGKTDLFISTKFGPRLRLVSILVESIPKIKVKPIDESRCGSCNICVKMCPAKASNGIPWNISTDRDEFFNAHKCREKCHEFGMQIFKRDVGICGICVAVCPIGRTKKR